MGASEAGLKSLRVVIHLAEAILNLFVGPEEISQLSEEPWYRKLCGDVEHLAALDLCLLLSYLAAALCHLLIQFGQCVHSFVQLFSSIYVLNAVGPRTT